MNGTETRGGLISKTAVRRCMSLMQEEDREDAVSKTMEQILKIVRRKKWTPEKGSPFNYFTKIAERFLKALGRKHAEDLPKTVTFSQVELREDD